MMEQLIAYRVWADGSGRKPEHGDCTVEQWETQRKQEVDERWKGTGYKVRVWPPQNFRKRGNNA